MSSRRWALKREIYENRSAVSVHVGQSDHRGQLNVSVNVQQPSGPEHRHRRKLRPNSGGAHGPFLPFPSPSLSSPPLPSLLSFLPLSSLPLLSPLLRSRDPQIQLGGLEERCKLPQRGLGRSPSRNRIWCILALKSVIWWQQFY